LGYLNRNVMRHAKSATMRRLITIILTILTTLSCFSQDWEKSFRVELFESLVNPSDSIYVMDRKLLEKILGMTCKENVVVFENTAKNGDIIKIKIEKQDFEPSRHNVYLFDTVNIIDNAVEVKNLIDNRYSYGIDGTMPRTEIKSMTIKWNEINLTIPDSAFSNLFQPHLCLDYLPVEAYIFNNQYLYIYISGSDAASGYSVKFVFDKRKYLTRIVGINDMTDGFDFLDGTAKYDD
jgi:hypothetical protein